MHRIAHVIVDEEATTEFDFEHHLGIAEPKENE
jgi:hypothetical protein